MAGSQNNAHAPDARRGEGQKAGNEQIDRVPFNLHRLTQRRLGEIDMMVVEIPVFAMQEFDVGPDGDQAAARLQAAQRVAQREVEAVLVRKVFEEIAGEDGIEAVVGQRPRRGAILMQKLHVRLQVLGRIGIEIHRPFFRGGDVIDKLPIAAAKIQDRVAGLNPATEKALRQDLPDPVAIGGSASETAVIDLGQILLIVGHAAGEIQDGAERSSQLGWASAWRAISSKRVEVGVAGCQCQIREALA